MKTLKFLPHLVPQILNGEKLQTWRLFDEKKLTMGDQLEFLNKETEEVFCRAEITSITHKRLADLNDDDREYFKGMSETELIAHYAKLYRKPVSPDTMIKIVHFRVLEKL